MFLWCGVDSLTVPTDILNWLGSNSSNTCTLWIKASFMATFQLDLIVFLGIVYCLRGSILVFLHKFIYIIFYCLRKEGNKFLMTNCWFWCWRSWCKDFYVVSWKNWREDFWFEINSWLEALKLKRLMIKSYFDLKLRTLGVFDKLKMVSFLLATWTLQK